MIQIELKGVDDALRMYNPKLVVSATRAALADAAKGAKVETSSLIRNRWNIKKRNLESRFTIKGAGRALERTLTIAGNPISLIYFNAREVTTIGAGVVFTSRAKSGGLMSRLQRRSSMEQGLSVEIIKGQRKTLKKAWLATVRSFAGRSKGGATLYGDYSARVLARGGGKSLVGPKSISVPSMFRQGEIAEKVIDRANAEMQRRFLYHLNRLTKL